MFAVPRDIQDTIEAQNSEDVSSPSPERGRARKRFEESEDDEWQNFHSQVQRSKWQTQAGKKWKKGPKTQGNAPTSAKAEERRPVGPNLVDEYVKKKIPESYRESASWAFKSEIPSSEELLPSKGQREAIAKRTQRLVKGITLSGSEEESDEDNCSDDEEILAANVVEGPYRDKLEYLETQYQLLREEAVAPLRDAIFQVAKNPQMTDEGNTLIYSRVRVNSFVFNARALGTRVSFSMARAGKRIRWDQSNRLRTGTLLALTPVSDAFRTKAIPAIVAAKDLSGLGENPPKIDLFIANDEDLETDPFNEYIMVESRLGYFEGVRHTLMALQTMLAEKNSPLMTHLVDLKPKVDFPDHLKGASMMNLDSLYYSAQPYSSSAFKSPYAKFDVVNDWPDEQSRFLDDSQMGALQRILTKKLAIVQGPPGTGKTHVSVEALRILINSQRFRDRPAPIVITAQTNHATDQLLRHIAHFETEFIRIGGQTQDVELIKPRTLREMTYNRGLTTKEMRNAAKDIDVVKKQMVQLIRVFTSQELLDSRELVKLGILRPEQEESLEKGAKRMVFHHPHPDAPRTPLALWLDEELVKAGNDHAFAENASLVEAAEEIPDDEEELDLEEAERPMRVTWDLDEDADRLKGDHITMEVNWTGRRCPGLPLKEVKAALRKDDLWSIRSRHRGSVYRHLYSEAMLRVRDKFRELAKKYHVATRAKLYARWWYEDFPLCRDQNIIAMTTTGLSKYRGLLHALQPQMILVEEAAETLECFITAACLESVQQLVLVGDHQQLRPHCSVSDLDTAAFGFTVSMFERLVRNDVEYSMLDTQRRMAPGIRELLKPIYPDLTDHPSVLDPPRDKERIPLGLVPRPPPRGMGCYNTWFLNHEAGDQTDEAKSRFNVGEAQLVISFANYLVQNGMATKEITILTMYRGQVRQIRKELRAQELGLQLDADALKIVTVDSYQGEENEVVLLSTVRNISSSAPGQLGFLQVKNRICVAISRARRGFYIFGSADLLGTKTPYNRLWPKILNILAEKERLHSYMKLVCHRHRAVTYVNQPGHFASLHGGCRAPCRGVLPCEHRCPLLCHQNDHSEVPCDEICNRPCEKCGTPCREMCYDICQCRACHEGEMDKTARRRRYPASVSSTVEEPAPLIPELVDAGADYHFFGDRPPKEETWTFNIDDEDEAEGLGSPLEPEIEVARPKAKKQSSGGMALTRKNLQRHTASYSNSIAGDGSYLGRPDIESRIESLEKALEAVELREAPTSPTALNGDIMGRRVLVTKGQWVGKDSRVADAADRLNGELKGGSALRKADEGKGKASGEERVNGIGKYVEPAKVEEVAEEDLITF